jgi:hypothetical protein
MGLVRMERGRALERSPTVGGVRRTRRPSLPDPFDSARDVRRLTSRRDQRNRTHRFAYTGLRKDEKDARKAAAVLNTIVRDSQEIVVRRDDHPRNGNRVFHLAAIRRPKQPFIAGRYDVDAASAQAGHDPSVDAFVGVET